MCLAVYLGTQRPLALPRALPGNLGVELATWTPAPLRERHSHVYYLGRRGEGEELECSCLLREHVTWSESGASVDTDELYPEAGPCPFDQLRELCAAALEDGGWATIVCDDGGGVDVMADADDYDASYVRLRHIESGALLFADAPGQTSAWRVLTVVP